MNAAAIRNGQGDLVMRADLRVEINAAVIKMILAQVAVAGVLFAALKLIP